MQNLKIIVAYHSIINAEPENNRRSSLIKIAFNIILSYIKQKIKTAVSSGALRFTEN